MSKFGSTIVMLFAMMHARFSLKSRCEKVFGEGWEKGQDPVAFDIWILAQERGDLPPDGENRMGTCQRLFGDDGCLLMEALSLVRELPEDGLDQSPEHLKMCYGMMVEAARSMESETGVRVLSKWDDPLSTTEQVKEIIGGLTKIIDGPKP